MDLRPGANGFIAAESAARAAPDGSTIFITSSTTQSTNPSLFKKLPYDPVKDFRPVGGVMQASFAVAVNNDLPVRTLSELTAWLKANPGKASYGWGNTTSCSPRWPTSSASAPRPMELPTRARHMP